jgi:hypothetical protein
MAPHPRLRRAPPRPCGHKGRGYEERAGEPRRSRPAAEHAATILSAQRAGWIHWPLLQKVVPDWQIAELLATDEPW